MNCFGGYALIKLEAVKSIFFGNEMVHVSLLRFKLNSLHFITHKDFYSLHLVKLAYEAVLGPHVLPSLAFLNQSCSLYI